MRLYLAFLEKAQSGLLVAIGGEQDVDGLAVLVDAAIEILPLTLDLDMRLVHPPTLDYQAHLAFPKG